MIILVTCKDRFTGENRRSLICAVESLYPRAKDLCALVITHCDNFKDEDQDCIVAEFQDVCRHQLPKVEAFVGNSIYTVGRQQRIAEDEKAISIRQLVKGSENAMNVQDALRLPNFCSRFKASIKSYCHCIFPVTTD